MDQTINVRERVSRLEILVSTLLGEKSNSIRQALASAIPSQERLQEAIHKNKASWAALRAKILGPSSSPEKTSLEAFVSHALRQGAPTQIAHVIQLVAKTVDEATFKKMLLLVDRLILLDDNYVATMEGLECALFQGMLYSEIGLFRRSWLIYRRALHAAQLLGLHRTRVGVWQDILWWALYQADRFSSLLIGAPYAVVDAHCNMTFGGKEVHLDATTHAFTSRLAIMCGKITDQSHHMQSSYSSLLTMNDEMTHIGAKMPIDYWKLDDLAPKDIGQAGEWQERALGQAIYYNTRLILHIPYLLKSVNNADYSYSRDVCFETSRNLIVLFQKMRAEANDHAYKTKVVDFSAYTATVTLVLGFLGYGQMDLKQWEADWTLIQATMDIFKRLSGKPFGEIAGESYRSLLQLTKICGNGSETDQDTKTEVMISFFGTVSVQRQRRPPSDDQVAPQNFATNVGPGVPLHNFPSPHPSVDPPDRVRAMGFTGNHLAYEHHSLVSEPPLEYVTPSVELQNVGSLSLDCNLSLSLDQDWSLSSESGLQLAVG